MVYLIINCFYDCFSCILILENIRIHMESTWNPWLFLYSMWKLNWMESRWNSSGIYVIVPGGFHIEYRWNGITKMAGISPKTYSMWNGWNPPGMIWIPYGFPVECGGRVKTSDGGWKLPTYTNPQVSARVYAGVWVQVGPFIPDINLYPIDRQGGLLEQQLPM